MCKTKNKWWLAMSRDGWIPKTNGHDSRPLSATTTWKETGTKSWIGYLARGSMLNFC